MGALLVVTVGRGGHKEVDGTELGLEGDLGLDGSRGGGGDRGRRVAREDTTDLSGGVLLKTRLNHIRMMRHIEEPEGGNGAEMTSPVLGRGEKGRSAANESK